MGLQVGVLGPLDVAGGTGAISIAGPRLQAVLGVLALRAGHSVSVAELIDAAWGEGAAPATAVKTVRSHVAHVRQTLRGSGFGDVLRPSPPGYLLDVPVAAVDRFRFERDAAAARALRDRGEHRDAAGLFAEALRHWRGDVLAGCELHGWAAADATRLAEARLAAIEDRLGAELSGGEHRAAIAELEYLVRRHPFRERLWELLMSALHADGRQADALAAYRRARAVLREELGVDPGRRLRELEAAVLRGDPATAPATQPATPPTARTPEPQPPADAADTPVMDGETAVLTGGQRPRPAGRVPAPVTRLVGRDADTSRVIELVHDHRLVTLSGPGGCGKTRVAIAAGQQLADRFDPVVFVDLAAVGDPELVTASVATALGVPLHPHQPLADTVAQLYAAHRPLLVMDNCAHLADACARLAEELLLGCPQLHVLATSQVALGASGEMVWSVPPLPVPPPGTASGDELARYAGAVLFAQRAGIADLTALSPADAAALGTVCAAVDGLPLALELAAARARVLSLPDLASALLTARFDVLAGGSRTARPQHRTLRACVEWSYALLAPEEQALLRALALVSGTCDLKAVAALCPPSTPAMTALDLVGQLVSKSLLVAERQPTGTRYRMLDTIRDYAAGLLAADPAEARIAGERHAAYYGSLAEQLDARLRGAELERVLDRFTADHDNLRTAMALLTGTGGGTGGTSTDADGADRAAALRLARASWQYCYLRGHYAEGRGWLRDALSMASQWPFQETPAPDGPEPHADPELVAAALDGAAALAHYACDYAEAAPLGERALALYRELGDAVGTAKALTRLGSISRERAEYRQAVRHHLEAMALFERAGDDWGVGHCMQLLGFAIWLSGDPVGAAEWSARAQRVLTAVDDKERIAWVQLDRGAELFHTGDADSAVGHLDRARRSFAEIGFKEGLAWADDLLAQVDLDRGDLLAALDRLTASMRLHHELGDRWRLASVLESLARVAAGGDDPAACADLLGMATATREAIGTPVPHCERTAVDRTVAWLADHTTVAVGWDGPPSMAVAAAHLARLRKRFADGSDDVG